MERIKENAIVLFDNMIKKSWTYKRLTKEEKESWYYTLNDVKTLNVLKGTFNQRWNVLQAIYGAFLNALGYNYNPGDWRDDEMKDAYDCKITYDNE